VANPEHVEKGVVLLKVDGRQAEFIPSFGEGTHEIEIVMGRKENRRNG
jgi:hypothetical protein